MTSPRRLLTAAFAAATDMVDLHSTEGPGLACGELVDLPYLAGLPPASAYHYVLAYWFVDGRPESMDADADGVPCESLCR